MALFNELQVGRFNRFAQKFFGIKGGPPMPTLASDLQLVLAFLSGYEARYLQGWDTFFSQVTFAASAGNNGQIELANPLTSNALIVLERISVSSSSAADKITVQSNRSVAGNPASGNQPTILSARSMDPRSRSSTAAVLSDNNGAAQTAIGGLVAGYYIQTLATANTVLEAILTSQELLLLPGDTLAVNDSVNASTLNVTLIWRERYFEEPERS